MRFEEVAGRNFATLQSTSRSIHESRLVRSDDFISEYGDLKFNFYRTEPNGGELIVNAHTSSRGDE